MKTVNLYHGFKRLIDFFMSLILLVLLSPIILMLALIIRFKLGSPVIFKQARPGLNEKIFNVYKFRSMTDEKDANDNFLSDAERLTPLGIRLRKLSLDELPQLINVLKGDMSFIGPRPLLIEYLPLYNEQQKKRHLVKPGITGWAQVNGRNAIEWERKFDLDIWYAEHESLRLDLKIFWLTFLKVIKRADISASNHVTMEKFDGNRVNDK